MTAPAAGPNTTSAGTAYGLLAYGIWGIFPLYFHALKPAGAWEILAHRIAWTMLLCLAILAVRRDWAWIRGVLTDRRRAAGLVAAAALIATNWVIYVIAVLGGRTYEAALGYFLNPLVTVGLGVLVLGERLRRLQWLAVAIGAAAGIYLAVAGGTLPWVAMSLALSFGLYGLLKKRLGATLDPWHSLFAETTILLPAAAVILAIIAARGESTYGAGSGHTVLLTLAGVVTAVPLLLFAAAAQRVPLVTIGLIQFITPVMQLLVGVLILKEHVTPALWLGFGIVWVALIILTIDSLRAAHRNRGTLPPLDPGAA
ncbi:EamA family transporter RarD [Nostocoides sp.]|uniref:EamA family transporter RarD n=1 Tax=Nostocoides sp. TaxID=1917966 RepID=UPI002C065623|nr:EamA family transporter RarD [Tetrasphaera sp.]